MMNTMQGFWAGSMRARAARRRASAVVPPKRSVRPPFAATLPQKPQPKPQGRVSVLPSISQAGTMLLPAVPLVVTPSSSFAEMQEAEVAATRDLVEKAVRSFYGRYHWLPEEILVSQHLLLSIPSGIWEYFPIEGMEEVGCFTVFLRLEASMEPEDIQCVGLPGRKQYRL